MCKTSCGCIAVGDTMSEKMIIISAGQPGWKQWLAHYRRRELATDVALMERHGYYPVPYRYPPDIVPRMPAPTAYGPFKPFVVGGQDA